MNYRTKENYDNTKERGEIITGESLTVPDESITVRQMIEMYTNGTLPPCYMKPIYEDDVTLDSEGLIGYDIDLTDLDDEARWLKERDEAIQAEIKSKTELKRKKLMEKRKRFEAWEKEQEKKEVQNQTPVE